MAKATCSVDGCSQPVLAKALCNKHYSRRLRTGSVSLTPRPDRESVFWERVRRGSVDECWEWTARRTVHGYGVFYVGRRNVLAHRFSLSLALGRPIGDGLWALHSCDNPPCVNPSHLREGTRAENVSDMVARGRGRGPGLKGERNPSAKITSNDAASIRALAAEGHLSQRAIGQQFGLSQQMVSAIVKGEKW